VSVEYEELPGWRFNVEEISVGVYRVTGTDEFGHRTSSEGLDPDVLLDECRSAAISIYLSGTNRE
jgi:hypothetical protein